MCYITYWLNSSALTATADKLYTSEDVPVFDNESQNTPTPTAILPV